MKILKRPENIIFDTENPDIMEFNPTPKSLAHPLNQITMKSDYDFLNEFFFKKQNVTHPIFLNFAVSFYYCIEI